MPRRFAAVTRMMISAAQLDLVGRDPLECRRQVGQGRRARDGDGHDVVDHQRGGGDQAEVGPEVLASHDIRAATARWIAAADLPIAEGNDGEHQCDSRGEPNRPGQRRHAGEHEHPQDLVRGVRGRRDGVRAEDRQGELLGQALLDLLGVRKGLPEHETADPGDALADGRGRGALAAALATITPGPA